VAEWTPFQTHYFFLVGGGGGVVLGIEPGPPDL
jgi:hypothetical protein